MQKKTPTSTSVSSLASLSQKTTIKTFPITTQQNRPRRHQHQSGSSSSSGKRATDNPWASAASLEETGPTPPPPKLPTSSKATFSGKGTMAADEFDAAGRVAQLVEPGGLGQAAGHHAGAGGLQLVVQQAAVQVQRVRDDVVAKLGRLVEGRQAEVEEIGRAHV